MNKAIIYGAVAAFANAKDTCNALVLSGGGSNGAWEMGVLWGLVHYGDPSEYEWDWITGVSAGSINLAAMVGFAVGDEVAMTEWVSDYTNSMTSDQIYTTWPEGVVRALWQETGLLSD